MDNARDDGQKGSAMSTDTETESGAKSQARAQLDSILELMRGIDKTEETGETVEIDGEQLDVEGIRQRCEENALSVQERSGWHDVGCAADDPDEFEILLCTGGPAVKILGDLNEHHEPDEATIQYQDWGTPWTIYRETTDEEAELLLAYCRTFYFGD